MSLKRRRRRGREDARGCRASPLVRRIPRRHHRSRRRDPSRRCRAPTSASFSDWTKNSVGLTTATVRVTAGAPSGDRARDLEQRLFEVATVVDGRFGSGRGGRSRGSARSSPDPCSRRDRGWRARPLLPASPPARRRPRCTAAPRPARRSRTADSPTPSPRRAPRRRTPDRRRRCGRRSGGSRAAASAPTHSSSTCGCAVRTRVDRWIASAAHDQVAAQHAVLDRAGRFERRRVAIVPAERLGCRRQRQDLHVRRRHHQLAGVELEETFARIERADVDAPDAPRRDRRPEDLRQVVAQLRARRRSERARLRGLRAAGVRARRRARGRAPSGAIGWPRRAAVIT